MEKNGKKRQKTEGELVGLLLAAVSFLLLLSLISFHRASPRSNWLGLLGHLSALGFSFLFGLMSFPLLIFTGYAGIRLMAFGKSFLTRSKLLFFGLFIASAALLFNLFAEWAGSIPEVISQKIFVESLHLHEPYFQTYTRHYLGGVPLYYLLADLPHYNFLKLLSHFGVFLTFSTTAIVSLLLFADLSPLLMLRKLEGVLTLSQKTWNYLEQRLYRLLRLLRPKGREVSLPPRVSSQTLERHLPPFVPPSHRPENREQEKIEKRIRTLPFQSHISRGATVMKSRGGYELPPPSLLKDAKRVDHPSLKRDLKRQAEILEETLMSFGIEAKVGDIHSGPTITSFEIHPAIGVKVQKIKTLENDIALNLQAKSIRIIAPIPGKAAVGVEIPSIHPQEVSFKEMLLFYQAEARKQQIPLLLGKSISGENVISDLAKMPHCLIAGATGSGKSVCINTAIMSILMNATPDEIKLLMVDPKKVELTAYSDLPHMIAPVITEPHGAYAALNWLVKEMQLRYEILKQLGLRNITSFNSRKVNRELESSLHMPIPEKMFAIVAIIDEFADLMLASSSDLETPIARIAQMARAVGIHLVLATQRPSREVITGLIKANFPTRIAFKVSSRVNSQIILDDVGAESLLGSGDLLFLPPGSSHLVRAQGAYISDEEIHKVIEFILKQGRANYLIPSFDKMRFEMGNENGEGPKDLLFEQAQSIVIETGSASTTFLQRKLKIGYARAASLMDELEAKGIIGPQEGAKPRRVLYASGKDAPGD